jgi:ADP-ribose pyrophosphatase
MHNNTANKSNILSTKTVFQSKFFQVNQVEIERDGKKFTKDIIAKTPVVEILPITENNEIYLESQYRDAFGETILEVIGGKIDPNEDLEKAAQRELEEETGLTATHWKQIATFELGANMQEKIYVFYATGLSLGKANLDEDEKIELIKMPLAQALEKIATGEIFVASDVAAILLLDKMMKEGKI